MAAAGKAVVKAVLSGDTLVLIGRASSPNATPPELQLTLSSLQAPRLARGPGTVDEPHAWESREFLRKLCIGKPCSFQVEYKVASIGRTFGSVTLDGEADSLCVIVAREGWARVKPVEQSKEGQRSVDYEVMAELGAAAESAKKGVYGDETGHIRTVKWNNKDYDSTAIFNTYKGTPVKAVIEHVRDGASFRALLLEEMAVLSFSLAGVAAPRMNVRPVSPPREAAAPTAGNGAAAALTESADMENGAEEGKTGDDQLPPPPSAIRAVAGQPPAQQPEPFAVEARRFTESRLLHREVDLLLQGTDSFGNFFGTVLHPKGNISVEILKSGLGRMQDWSSAFLPRDSTTTMRSAENTAKLTHVGLWKTWKAPVIQGDQEFNATVIEVHSGDQVSVLTKGRPGAAAVERRIALSSVKAPKTGNPRRGVPDEPWAAEAKNSLRAKLIGREVNVSIDYERDVPQGDDPAIKRAFATIMVGKAGKEKNAAELIIAEGMAQVVRHRQDEARCRDYDALMAAEKLAQEGKKGRWSGKEPPQNRSIDLTADSKKAKQHFPFLQRQPLVKGIVEHVFAGHRFKIYIPKENCAIMLAVNTIRCPRPTEPFGEQARLHSRAAVMQRNVDIQIVDMDKNGVFLGTMTLNDADFALGLLAEGLAKCDERAVGRLGTKGRELMEREAKAKDARKGLWSLQDNSVATEDTQEEKVSAAEELVDVKLSDICDGGRVYVQFSKGDGMNKVEDMLKKLKEEVGVTGAALEPRSGTLCAALFDDGSGKGPQWFRARINGRAGSESRSNESAAAKASARGGQFSVTYVDFGNTAIVDMTKLRPLDRSFFILPFQATECVLAYTRVPPLGDEFGREAAVALSEKAWGKTLKCRMMGKDNERRAMVALYTGDSDDVSPASSINAALIQEGLARVSKDGKAALMSGITLVVELVQALQEAQKVAHKARVNMWRYGDCTSDDEDDFPSLGGRRGR